MPIRKPHGYDGTGTESVDDDSAISIFADGLRIFVASDEMGVPVRIVDMMGRILIDQPLHAYAAYPVPAAGIYLVKVGDRPAKKISVVK
jgi:hypothetical protein